MTTLCWSQGKLLRLNIVWTFECLLVQYTPVDEYFNKACTIALLLTFLCSYEGSKVYYPDNKLNMNAMLYEGRHEMSGTYFVSMKTFIPLQRVRAQVKILCIDFIF